jgi:DNA glycosylase AlkZ-like
MITLSEVALLRLVAQRIAGTRCPTAADAVCLLTAAQGQDYPGALTSIALRTADGRRAGVTAAMDAGAVVRSWPMRGTLHLVAAEDLHWLLELLGPRILGGAATRRARLDLTERDTETARGLVVAALSGRRRLRREDLLAVLADGGVTTTGQRGYHLLWYLAQTGTLCLGPTCDGGEQLFVLLDEWVRKPRRLERDEALGELTLRYFRGHGPATVKDLVRWAGSTVRDVRIGLAIARPQLSRLEVDGVEHFLDPEVPDRLATCRKKARGVFLLPGFDEFVLGYGERGAVLDPEFADRIVPGGNGMFRATVVSDGRIVGTWRYTGSGSRRTATATPFTVFSEEVTTVIPRLAAALAQ